jgi:hypothetical protein
MAGKATKTIAVETRATFGIAPRPIRVASAVLLPKDDQEDGSGGDALEGSADGGFLQRQPCSEAEAWCLVVPVGACRSAASVSVVIAGSPGAAK